MAKYELSEVQAKLIEINSRQYQVGNEACDIITLFGRLAERVYGPLGDRINESLAPEPTTAQLMAVGHASELQRFAGYLSVLALLPPEQKIYSSDHIEHFLTMVIDKLPVHVDKVRQLVGIRDQQIGLHLQQISAELQGLQKDRPL